MEIAKDLILCWSLKYSLIVGYVITIKRLIINMSKLGGTAHYVSCVPSIFIEETFLY